MVRARRFEGEDSSVLVDYFNALTPLTMVELCGQEIAVQAAENIRFLRASGVTVRKTIDCIIATRCIAGGYDLLHNDRDFDPFVRYLGLRVIG